MNRRLPQQDWMSGAQTRRLIEALAGAAGDVRFVGGCVRDAVAGRPVADIDIGVPLEPGRVVDVLNAAGIKALPTGIDHGTVTAIVDHRPYEITSLRRDVETDGRRAVVAYTADWEEDAARRDFTINAMSCRPDGALFDYFGGLGDLEAGRVRFVGDARTRIREDVLRILRFYRFFAHYGAGAPDAAARAACTELASLIPGLSAERIWRELKRLLEAPAPQDVLEQMAEDGVLEHILRGADRQDGLARLARLISVEEGLGAADAVRRLAALLDDGADAEATARDLKLSNADRRRLMAMRDAAAGFKLPKDEAALRRKVYRMGGAPWTDAALLWWAAGRNDSDPGGLRAMVEAAGKWQPPVLPVDGGDVKACGVEAGPAVGAALAAVEAWWIAEDFAPGREAALEKLRAVVAGQGSAGS